MSERKNESMIGRNAFRGRGNTHKETGRKAASALSRPIARALGGTGEAARLARCGAPLLVAVSGGADSTALLHALVRVRGGPDGLVVAHFNHGIRGAEADADEAFVRDLCASLGVPFRGGAADVPAEASRTGESLEMTARRLRHAFLDATARTAGARAVALGHTLDDQLELFLLRLARGAGLRGLAAMPPVSPGPTPRIRPFLRLRHAQLEDFLRSEGLAWREDSSNAQDDALRNRLRHRAVPALLAACGPGLPATLDRTLSLLREDADLLDELAAAAPDSRSAEPAPIARRRIARALYDAGADPETVSLDTIERVRALLARGRNAQVPIGGGLAARLDYGALSFVREAPDAPPPAPAAFRLPAHPPVLAVEPAAAVERPPRGDFLARPVSCTVRADALAGRRLALRPWRAGDRIAVAGGRGTRKLSDVFADAKLPRVDRARVLLLADDATGEVLWLPGHGVARELAVRPGDGMLRLTLLR